MEDSATDIPELWIPDRNDEDTKFVRGQGDAIPTKKCPQAALILKNIKLLKKKKNWINLKFEKYKNLAILYFLD